MKILIEFDSLQDAAAFIDWQNYKQALAKSEAQARAEARAEAKDKRLISSCGLGVRITNALMAEGFKYVEDALDKPDEWLLKIPNLGRRSLGQLREWAALNPRFS